MESKQFCTHGVHVQHSKAERYHTSASKFTDTITVVHVYGMYTELSLFSAYPLLSTYYLTVYIYRRMHLTTGVYSMYMYLIVHVHEHVQYVHVHVHCRSMYMIKYM